MKTTLFLIRHAQAEGNLYRRVHGQYNSPLTALGFKQANLLALRFKTEEIDAIYSSDLRRTMQTAQPLAEQKNLPITPLVGLRELHHGIWENLTWGDLLTNHSEDYMSYMNDTTSFVIPGGESHTAVVSRFSAALKQIVAENEGKKICVFSHAGIIRSYLNFMQDEAAKTQKDNSAPLPQIGFGDNTNVTKIIFENGILEICYISDSSHIPEEMSTFTRQMAWKREGECNMNFENALEATNISTARTFLCNFYKELWSINITQDNAKDFFINRAKNPLLHQVIGYTPSCASALGLYSVCGEEGYVELLYVKPERRRMEMSMQLLGEGVDFFRSLKVKKIFLMLPNGFDKRFASRYGFVLEPSFKEHQNSLLKDTITCQEKPAANIYKNASLYSMDIEAAGII